MNYHLFDIIEYLDDKKIPYSSHSKHTTTNHINLACPFCGDDSDHLGIDLSTKACNCWRCGGKHITRVVQELEGGCSSAEANTIINTYSHGVLPHIRTGSFGRTLPKTKIPKLATFQFPSQHLAYLTARKFNAEELIEKYKLMAIVNSVGFKQRILIPVFEDTIIVTFTTLDITGKQSPKYLACSTEKSLKSIKSCVYNIDSIENIAIIVEGPTDVWRLGDGAVATFGTAFTSRQIDVIRKKHLTKAFVMYDGEDTEKQHARTLRQAEDLACCLLPVVRNRNVELIEMSHGDPDSMTEEEVEQLRKDVFS